MDFNPDTWGTVAEWVGGLGTTAAFLITAIVVYRDTKVRRESQARQVAYIVRKPAGYIYASLQGKEIPVTYVISNMSPEPIYDVLQYTRGHLPGHMSLIHHLDVLLPTAEFEIPQQDFNRKDPPLLCFRDNSGHRWLRSVSGYVHPAGRKWLVQRLPANFNKSAPGLRL